MHLGYLFGHFCFCRFPHFHEQLFGGLGGAGHLVGGHIGCEVGISHYAGFLGACLYNLAYQRTVVEFARCGVGGVAFPHFFAEVAVFGVLKHGQAAGGVECEGPFAFVPAAFSLGGSIIACVLGDAGKVSLVVNDDFKGVVGRKEVLVELEVEVGESGVYLFELLLLVGGESGSAAFELAVGLFDGTALVKGLVYGIDGVVDRLHAFEELLVHHHVVSESGVQRHDFLGNLGKLGCGVGLDKGHEHRHHAVKGRAEAAQRLDGVFKGGGFGIGDDGVNPGVGFGDSGLECGHVVGNLDFVERRNLVLRFVGLHERIFVL